MNFIRRLIGRSRLHHRTKRMPRWIRRRIYEELLAVREDEKKMQVLLELPVKPRLSVVDERWVVMLRPGDRHRLELDDEALVSARERQQQHEQDEGEEEPEGRIRGPR